MALRPWRATVVHLAHVLLVLGIAAKAAHVQLWHGGQWTAAAQHEHFVTRTVPAPRGAILDVTGTVLAESRDMRRVSVAPKEVLNRGGLQELLLSLRVPPASIARSLDTSRTWVTLPGLYLAMDVERLASLRGVYTEAVMQRVYRPQDPSRGLLGRVNVEGTGTDGLERELEPALAGTPGRVRLQRDSRAGLTSGGPSLVDAPVVPGHTVLLTINENLQDIAATSLHDAVDKMHAEGGDIVILDPATGEVRAMVSERGGAISPGNPAMTEPYEPGSTLKPITAAGLLELGRARPDEVVNTEHGRYTVEGRTITDDEPHDALSLRDVIRVSSNIGITKFASRLTPDEQYANLRRFGLGQPTGLPYPIESSGRLRPPSRWSKQSRASLAMGYELAVTPLQLAAAYGAIANGGELLEPTLVKEVRDAGGTVRYRHRRRVVRRVIRPEVAATVRDMMKGVLEDGGTAAGGNLGTFTLAGKTGTARRVVHGRYDGSYNASFVGLFPADKPQYVIVVKIDNPTTVIFGGKAAAPVSRAILEAAIATRDAALDWRALLKTRARPALAPITDSTALDSAVVQDAEATEDAPVADTVSDSPPDLASSLVPIDTAPSGAALADRVVRRWATALPVDSPQVVSLPVAPTVSTGANAPALVPDVQGLTMRRATAALLAAGFRVRPTGTGVASGTFPPAGMLLPHNGVIELRGSTPVAADTGHAGDTSDVSSTAPRTATAHAVPSNVAGTTPAITPGITPRVTSAAPGAAAHASPSPTITQSRPTAWTRWMHWMRRAPRQPSAPLSTAAPVPVPETPAPSVQPARPSATVPPRTPAAAPLRPVPAHRESLHKAAPRAPHAAARPVHTPHPRTAAGRVAGPAHRTVTPPAKGTKAPPKPSTKSSSRPQKAKRSPPGPTATPHPHRVGIRQRHNPAP